MTRLEETRAAYWMPAAAEAKRARRYLHQQIEKEMHGVIAGSGDSVGEMGSLLGLPAIAMRHHSSLRRPTHGIAGNAGERQEKHQVNGASSRRRASPALELSDLGPTPSWFMAQLVPPSMLPLRAGDFAIQPAATGSRDVSSLMSDTPDLLSS